MKIKNLRLETGYLVEPIALGAGPPAHRIEIMSIAGEGSPRVRISLDPNRCGVDSFGDPRGCTRIAVLRKDAAANLLEDCDGKLLFSLELDGGGPVVRLALLPPCTGAELLVARLLVFGEGVEMARILPLQVLPATCVVV